MIRAGKEGSTGECPAKALPENKWWRRARLRGTEGNAVARRIDAETPPSLLLRIRDHLDREAWAEFAEVYSPLIYGFCRARRLQAADAADVTQEVLLRVAKAIRTFEYNRQEGLFRDWLARIVSNEVKRHLARRKDPNLPEGFDVPTMSDQWNEAFHQHIVQAALQRCRPHFTEQTWNVFVESWVKQRTAADVAATFHISVDKVYVARSRVLKRLRREVTVLSDDLL